MKKSNGCFISGGESSSNNIIWMRGQTSRSKKPQQTIWPNPEQAEWKHFSHSKSKGKRETMANRFLPLQN